MDWLKQSQDMFQKMMSTQQKLWETWSTTVKDVTGIDPNSAWKKSVQTWENSFNNFIETQALFSKMWARNVSADNPTPGSREYVKAVEDVTQAWIDTQKKLWGSWFEVLMKFDPNQMSESSRAQAADAMQAWQQNLQQMIETNTEWVNKWMDTLKSDKSE